MSIRTDGGVGTPVTSRAHSGSGPNAQRQERSHAHCIQATPDNRYVVVADLGTDKLMTYRFDGNFGELTPAEVPYLDLPPGSGPRHFVFHPSARFAYVINGLEASIATISFDQFSGSFQILDVVDAAGSLSRGERLRRSSDQSQRALSLWSNRGHDSIAIHAVNQSTGRLMLVGHQSTLGEHHATSRSTPQADILSSPTRTAIH